MFERIHQLRKNSESFVNQLNVHKAESIEESEKELISLNQKQLQASEDLTGSPLKPLYSPAYAEKKGYKKPDGYLSGDMYKEMFVDANENDDSFSIFSFKKYTKYFNGRYGDVFGIGDKSVKEATRLVLNNLRNKYNKLVLK